MGTDAVVPGSVQVQFGLIDVRMATKLGFPARNPLLQGQEEALDAAVLPGCGRISFCRCCLSRLAASRERRRAADGERAKVALVGTSTGNVGWIYLADVASRQTLSADDESASPLISRPATQDQTNNTPNDPASDTAVGNTPATKNDGSGRLGK